MSLVKEKVLVSVVGKSEVGREGEYEGKGGEVVWGR